MEILGIEKVSFVDFGDKICATIFTGGCNYRCPFCHNSGIVKKEYKKYDEDEILNYLSSRKSLLDAVTISGGEPTLQPDIEQFVQKVKNLGYIIKLDTNGTFPDKLSGLLSDKAFCPDFIAIDVKTSLDKYQLLGSSAVENIEKSIKIISELPTERREFRTVLVPPLVDMDNIKKIAALLPEDASWQLANFKPGNCLDESYNKIIPYTQSQIEELVNSAKTIIKGANLR